MSEKIVITEPGVYDNLDEEALFSVISVGKYFALVEPADFELVRLRTWHPLHGHNGKVYAYTSTTCGSVYMHRLIAGTPAGYETDHVNGNGLDNRRVNLRTATASQNSANMWKPRRPGGGPHSSQYKGVSWDRSRSKWQAKITVSGLCRNLGRYGSEADAATAYDTAAREAWGDFALVNFVDGVRP